MSALIVDFATPPPNDACAQMASLAVIAASGVARRACHGLIIRARMVSHTTRKLNVRIWANVYVKLENASAMRDSLALLVSTWAVLAKDQNNPATGTVPV